MALANQSAAFGLVHLESYTGEQYGPYFAWNYSSTSELVDFWRFDLKKNRATEVISMSGFRVNHSVVSTPPLSVYTDAPSAFLMLEEGGATPLRLSMTNTTCGAPPCRPR